MLYEYFEHCNNGVNIFAVILYTGRYTASYILTVVYYTACVISRLLCLCMANIPQVPGGHKLVYWPIGTKSP